MELSKDEMKVIKGLAALFLVFLHLFNNRENAENIKYFMLYKNVPIEYYLSLVAGSCVPIYLFCSGYGLSIISKNKTLDIKSNFNKIFKLLINYWIVLMIFVVIGYLLGNSNYPGSAKEFLMNFFLLSKSYNGAWWFLQSYVILVILSKNIVKIVNKNSTIVVFIISGTLYFIAFLQSTKGIISVSDSEITQIIYNLIVNFLYCQFSFILGVIFIKEEIISKIRNILNNKKYNQLLAYILLICIFIINIVIENWIIDPITAISIIMIFSIIKLNKWIENLFKYISIHSTNIWLIHMFFYMIFFSKIVYAPKYSIIIFIWLVLLCIFTSYIINLIYSQIIKFIGYKFNNIDDVRVSKYV